MRLGAYDESGHICDYTNKNCSHYQEFGIEKIIPSLFYGIALIRLDRPIQFGPKLKPICLPFGNNRIEELRTGATFTAAGWHTEQKGKADRNFIFKSDYCVDKRRVYCYLTFENGIELYAIMYQFAPQRMVLEAIPTQYISLGSLVLSSYTQVRNYKGWLDHYMQM